MITQASHDGVLVVYGHAFYAYFHNYASIYWSTSGAIGRIDLSSLTILLTMQYAMAWR
jgi:hypothetical protein